MLKFIQRFFARRNSKKIYRQGIAQDMIPQEFHAPINELLRPFRIHAWWFMNNMVYLENEGMPSLSIESLGQPPPEPSRSAVEFQHRGDRPPGYPLWFLAAFPDVAFYASFVTEHDARAEMGVEHNATAVLHKKLLERTYKYLTVQDVEEFERTGKLTINHARVMVVWFKEATRLPLELAC